jgi:hypothetical protein
MSHGFSLISPTGFLDEFLVACPYNVSSQFFLHGFLGRDFGLQYGDSKI